MKKKDHMQNFNVIKEHGFFMFANKRYALKPFCNSENVTFFGVIKKLCRVYTPYISMLVRNIDEKNTKVRPKVKVGYDQKKWIWWEEGELVVNICICNESVEFQQFIVLKELCYQKYDSIERYNKLCRLIIDYESKRKLFNKNMVTLFN